MFCGCSTAFGAPPNTQTCPVCQGMPGSLPVINRRAVEFGIRTALALGCRINLQNRFARKHYYYPDMPKNYQISQYEEPLAEHGALDVAVAGASRVVGIQRLHLEEDVGKLVHEGDLATARSSQVDYNRAGVPLMEIVSKPDMRSPEEAAAYLRAMRAIAGVPRRLRREHGGGLAPLRRQRVPPPARQRDPRHQGRDQEHELLPPRPACPRVRGEAPGSGLDSGERLVQETRLWDPERARTVSMRSKEFAHDYRYFPEPDLPPLEMDATEVELIRASLPELPAAKRRRFVEAYGLTPYEADLLCQGRGLAEYFEAATRESGKPKAVANWVLNELLRELPGDDDAALAACPITPSRLAGLLKLVDDGTISGRIAKDVFPKMYQTSSTAADIVNREGLTQVADEGALGEVVDQVLAQNPKVVEDLRGGKKAAKGFLVGQVMKSTQGKANPAIVNRLIDEKLLIQDKLPKV